MPRRFRTLNSQTIYTGRVLELKVDRVIEPGGVTAVREIVRHSGSVVVLPQLSDGRWVLVRQFRYAARTELWELVAGGIEPGESVIAAARRELREETGYRARAFKPLLSFFPSPGFLTEQMHLVEARGLALAQAAPEADERIRVGLFTLAQLRALLRKKGVHDGKTLIGLLWLLTSDRL
ncbi:MAG TPA: NUDIX hydrolase [Terriglobia bacterium]|nr:NUDIX hydrolase [Terriglobia bacterium]